MEGATLVKHVDNDLLNQTQSDHKVVVSPFEHAQIFQQTSSHSLTRNNSVVTPVRILELSKWLKGYDCTKAKFLIDGFTHGFYIPFHGDNQFLKSGNLRSVSDNVDVLSEYIEKERLAGRIAGPFVAPPFQNFKCSPIFSVPKHTGDGFCTIHNLSYPEEFAVNDGIPEKYKYVQYQNIDNAVELTRKYKRGCFYSKCDIEHAYKIVPIHPSMVSITTIKLYLWV